MPYHHSTRGAQGVVGIESHRITEYFVLGCGFNQTQMCLLPSQCAEGALACPRIFDALPGYPCLLLGAYGPGAHVPIGLSHGDPCSHPNSLWHWSWFCYFCYLCLAERLIFLSFSDFPFKNSMLQVVQSQWGR